MQEYKTKKLTQTTKKYIATLLISQIIIVFLINIIQVRLIEIIASLLGIIILITCLYQIITNNNDN